MIRQERDNVDLVGTSKQANRSWPMQGPACSRRRRNGVHTADATFWNVTRHRRYAINPLPTIADDIDERCHVDDLILYQ